MIPENPAYTVQLLTEQPCLPQRHNALETHNTLIALNKAFHSSLKCVICLNVKGGQKVISDVGLQKISVHFFFLPGTQMYLR